ncbi:MAG: pyridoxamine 5'-phosphate oxidase family protein [Oscillospiraceae bacterium]
MDYKKEFERMMQSQTAIALATASGGAVNVRIVNFYYDTDRKSLYFSTFRDNEKVAELAANPCVAFTTIPTSGEEHVRVKSGTARQSALPIAGIKENFLAKLPDYIMGIPELLPELILFEITFDRADVVLDFEHMETIAL